PPPGPTKCLINPNARGCYFDGRAQAVIGAFYEAGPLSCANVPVEIDTGTSLAELTTNPPVAGQVRWLTSQGKPSYHESHWRLRAYEPATIQSRVFAAERSRVANGGELIGAFRYRATGPALLTLPEFSVDSDGDARWDGTGAVSDGVYALRFESRDRCDHAAALERFVELDQTGPWINFETPLHNSETDSAIVPVRAAVADWHGGTWSLSVSTDGQSTWSELARGSVEEVEDPLGSQTGTPKFLAQWSTRGRTGTVYFRMQATDPLGNGSHQTVALQLQPREALLTSADINPTVFSPNGDGSFDHARLTLELRRPVYADIFIEQRGDIPLGSWIAQRALPVGRSELTWDGRVGSNALIDGEYQMRVRLRDAEFPEQAEEHLLTLAIDTHPPVVSEFSPEAPFANCGEQVRFRVSDEHEHQWTATLSSASGATVTELQGSGNQNVQLASLSALEEGDYAAELVMVDQAGNEARFDWTFTLDCNAPTVAISSPEDNAWVPAADGRALTVTGSVTDANFDRYELRLAELPDESPLPGSGDLIMTANAEVTDGTLASWVARQIDGPHAIGLIAYDRAGNVSQAWRPLRFDGQPPIARITWPASGDTASPHLEMEGTASDENFDHYELQLSPP
ncbi:MAG: hypothetical protein KDC95_23940, partial [Planctomycetes bacterium]|nr:hypothetical protein [Planctomycetota bacterium]